MMPKKGEKATKKEKEVPLKSELFHKCILDID